MLKIQQPSSLTFPSQLLKVPNASVAENVRSVGETRGEALELTWAEKKLRNAEHLNISDIRKNQDL